MAGYCNQLGSNAGCQAALMVGSFFLFLIAVVMIVLSMAMEEEADNLVSFMLLEWLGALLVWALALFMCIPRCCAPCCCQNDMPDVPPPCPMRTAGWLDCPLLTGLWISVIFGSLDMMFAMTASDLSMLRLLRLVRVVWIIFLMVGLCTGVYKFTLMQKGPLEGAPSAALQPKGGQVVGQPVTVDGEKVVS